MRVDIICACLPGPASGASCGITLTTRSMLDRLIGRVAWHGVCVSSIHVHNLFSTAPCLRSHSPLAGAAHAEEALDLGKVVVSAAGFEQNIAEAPASISVISREELEKQSYTSVIDAVKNIPGVFVTGGGNNRDI